MVLLEAWATSESLEEREGGKKEAWEGGREGGREGEREGGKKGVWEGGKRAGTGVAISYQCFD